jgi:hypothetical protein
MIISLTNTGYFCFHFFIISPFVEWFFHFIFHVPPKLKSHKNHHLEYFKNEVTIEHWPLFFVTFFYYFQCYLVCMGILKYWAVHTIIHKRPFLLPVLSEHHFYHHKNPDKNYAVSAVFPDKILGTFEKNVKVKKKWI